MYKINSLLWQRKEKGKRRGWVWEKNPTWPMTRRLLSSSCSVMSHSLWPMGCSMPGSPCRLPFPSLLSHHQKLGQTHVRWVGNAIVTLDNFLLFYCTDPKSLILLYGGTHNHLKRAFWSEHVLLALEFSIFMEAVHSRRLSFPRILGKESKCLVLWWWWFSH